MIPGHCRESMRLYVEHGVLPGSFLTAVLCNDFMEACGKADDVNRHLWDYANFLYNYAPSNCFGSPEAVKAWVAAMRDNFPEEPAS